MSHPSSGTSGTAIFHTDSEEKQHCLLNCPHSLSSLFWKFFQLNPTLFILRLENRLIGCGHKERGKSQGKHWVIEANHASPAPHRQRPPLVHRYGSSVETLVIPAHDRLWGNFLKDGKDSVRNTRIKTPVLTHAHYYKEWQVSTLWGSSQCIGNFMFALGLCALGICWEKNHSTDVLEIRWHIYRS